MPFCRLFIRHSDDQPFVIRTGIFGDRAFAYFIAVCQRLVQIPVMFNLL